ncbi:response regulator transcription factor [Cohnella faecalis]|uniref:response regulator transcription factor n=1 Tax=Cohnella faecalis TaxID=2315694 RepID=UPI0026BBCC4E|nr:response regulator transcription factor [Cohnella faecalis]
MTRVLVVEDDHIIGEMLTLYLSEEGFTIMRAETAADGLKAVSDFQPEVILLDLMLPDAEGTEICARFRQHTPLPIIVISMKSAVADRIQAISAGADDYLCKPFSMQELKVRIGAVLRRTYASASPHYQATAPSSPPSAAIAVQAGLALDLERRTIVLEGKHIETTFSEYEIMKLFYQYPARCSVGKN